MTTLAEVLEERNILLDEFKKKTGLSQSTYSRVCQGKAVSRKSLKIICRAFQINPRGLEPPQKRDKKTRLLNGIDPTRLLIQSESPPVVELGTRTPAIAHMARPVQSYMSHVIRCDDGNSYNLNTLEHKGVRMDGIKVFRQMQGTLAPRILPGDLLLVDTTRRAIVDGAIHAVRLNRMPNIHFARVTRIGAEDLLLHYDDQAVVSLEVPAINVTIVGLVVWFCAEMV